MTFWNTAVSESSVAVIINCRTLGVLLLKEKSARFSELPSCSDSVPSCPSEPAADWLSNSVLCCLSALFPSVFVHPETSDIECVWNVRPGERLTRRTDLESPRPAPVARLAARFAHCVRCSACVAGLPGADLALSVRQGQPVDQSAPWRTERASGARSLPGKASTATE